MYTNEFKEVLEKSKYSKELKEKILGFYSLLNEKGKLYLLENLQSIIDGK